uniref:Vacuolar ATPase assembly protein VMA22 n=1 Tax=Oryzias sinensis TaxID=183150 RepID=A0A8C7XVH6_9TELE
MGGSEVQDTRANMDEELLRFMDLLELLEKKRETLNSLIEQGWFSITKARYSMGNKHVSALQYASEMVPLVCVHTKALENGEVQFFTERHIQKSSAESSDDLLPVEDIGPQEEGLRRRNKTKKDTPEKKDTEVAKTAKGPEVNPVRKIDQNPQQDPLKWFGILVPQPLKQAQSSFKQVIELSAEIAALQSAVLRTRQKLRLSLAKELNSEKSLGKSAKEKCPTSDLTVSEQKECIQQNKIVV